MDKKTWDELCEARRREVHEKIEAAVCGMSVVYDNIPEVEKSRIIDLGLSAYRWLECEFYDRNRNIRRWLTGEPCIFCNDLEGVMMEITIEKDYDVFYQFLEFCRKQNFNLPVDGEYLDYMEHLSSLAKPCN